MAPDGPDSRDAFRSTADEYRRVSGILRWPSYAAILFWPLLLIPKASEYAYYRTVGIAGFVGCLLVSLIASLIWLPRLTCPSCQEKLDPGSRALSRGGLGPYCPECGAGGTIEDGWLGQKCTACGKALTNGRGGRSYKIRYCTRCDAHVDDEGV